MSDPRMMPELLPVPVASERTGIPSAEIYKMIQMGLIHGAYRGYLGLWTVPADFLSRARRRPAHP